MIEVDPAEAHDFRRLSITERRELLARHVPLSAADLDLLDAALAPAAAERMIENVVGIFALPLGIAMHFVVDGHPTLVPMAIEEPSVVAAASHAAKLVSSCGGFKTSATENVMVAQVEVRGVQDTAMAARAIEEGRPTVHALVDAILPSLVARGGGFRGVACRVLSPSTAGAADGRVVVDVELDVGDAMGANVCNTVAEALGGAVARLAGGAPGLRILTNLCDRRLTTVRARASYTSLERGPLRGKDVADAVVEASRFAELDPYRAATHNKGILNGIDAVAVAAGQDWRAIEAGAHAFAATRAGRAYAPLSRWWTDDTAECLCGEMTLPLAVGVVGGALRVHAGARLALRLMGARDARTLAAVIAAAGLATNLAALRALATEGIQRGHMALHARAKDRDD